MKEKAREESSGLNLTLLKTIQNIRRNNQGDNRKTRKAVPCMQERKVFQERGSG